MQPPLSRELDAAAIRLDRLVIQRPAKLERLSSTATARASSLFDDDSPPQTATQSPRRLHASDLSSFLDPSGSISKSAGRDTDVLSRTSMTSPDSWRSLLPEHDPYFASDHHLRGALDKPSASSQGLHPSSSAVDIDAYAAAKSSPRASASDCMSTSSAGTSRTSFSSIISGYSTMSMSSHNKSSRKSQDSARSDSWRSLLPDDDRYHASRAANATDLAPSGLAASSNLASPCLSDRLDSPTSSDGLHHLSALLAHQTPRSDDAAPLPSDPHTVDRRHASFSSAEPSNTEQQAARRVMLAGLRDSPLPFTESSSSQNFERSAKPYASSSSSCSSAGAVSPPVCDSPGTCRMTPELSQSTTADEASERDNWPTSRPGRYGFAGISSSSSSGPSTPETPSPSESGPTSISRSSLLAAAVSKHQRTPPRAFATSDSADVVTRSRPISTSMSTSAQPLLNVETSFALSKSPSEADEDEGPRIVEGVEGEFQNLKSRSRTSSCSISSPISPSCLPFLERRPAPDGTKVEIEKERSKYTVRFSLPGFSLNCITVATKRNASDQTLHVVADKWDAEGGGHFDRRVHFSDKDCDMANVKSEFDGNTLRVTVPRKSKDTLCSSSSSARS